MATKYNDIVTLRQMRPAYNIKAEAPDDWKTFIANDLFNNLLRQTVAAVRNNDQDKHRSIWISGTYGSGKSHAGSVLKHLLCDPIENVEEFVNDEYREEKYASIMLPRLTVNAGDLQTNVIDYLNRTLEQYTTKYATSSGSFATVTGVLAGGLHVVLMILINLVVIMVIPGLIYIAFRICQFVWDWLINTLILKRFFPSKH